ncbi:phosphoadenosine phosphosulfate reductase family protein [Rhodococcus hoagii]|nr:phosphoadenosine phosphosulfate reductase family protein [Prescottella equi]
MTNSSTTHTTAALWEARDLYVGDPLRPDLEIPTPAVIVAGLSRREREKRVGRLVEQAEEIYRDGVVKHLGDKKLAAACILFSGGNDSTVLAHLFRNKATHAIHANTTIGIEKTRQFVRDTCQAWGLPLLEEEAPTTYRDLVLERGFPGPAMHFKMFQRLKERGLMSARRKLVADSRRERVVFIAGRRRAESARRSDIPLDERRGSVIWVSPLAMWTKLDMNTYRLMCGDVPVNEVSDLIHMSGECLCGAFAKPGELEEIRAWFPEAAAAIDQLERDARAAGHPEPFCRWGHGMGGAPSKSGALCSSCSVEGQLEMFTDRE